MEDYFTSYGFKSSFGSFSDISILCPKWGIGGVNLSIGYYSQHTSSEILKIDEWQNTVDRVEAIILNPPEKQFEYIAARSTHDLFDYGFDRYYSLNVYADILNIDVLDVNELVANFGGTEEEWEIWLGEQEYAIKEKIVEKSWEAIDELINDNIPEFLLY
jgi:hypothetical protein